MTKKKQLITLIFLLTFLVSNLFIMFPMNNSDSHFNSEKLTEDNQVDNENDPINDIESPISSKIGLDAWWNSSWRYRQLINITNPVPGWSFTNYPTSIVFNYTAPKYTDILNSLLTDIRIVQNGVLRKYYFQENYPENELVTVWFDVDIDTEADTDHTYMYFNGSDTVSIDPTYYIGDVDTNLRSDAFGYIRNGNFELEQTGIIGDDVTNLFGWTYSDLAIDTYDWDDEDDYGNNQHGLTDVTVDQSRVIEGNVSFKWGDPKSHLNAEPDDDQDYEGTLYSFPFIIPEVSGFGAELKIKVFRNVRTYSEDDKKKTGFFLRLADDYDDIEIQNHDVVIEQEDYLAIKKEVGHRRDRIKYRTFVQDQTGGGGEYDTKTTFSIPYDPEPPDSTDDGDLTGYVEINVQGLAGSLVFLEAGLYGRERDKQTAFAQIDDVKYNYEIEAALNDDIQVVSGELTFIAKDVDGRIVPDAEVKLFNDDVDIDDVIAYTSEQDGSVTFSNVPYGYYNVTVNYTLQHSGKEEEVYDSRDDSTEFLAEQGGYTIEITLDMATIDFEVVDYGGYPLEYGYINISNTDVSDALEILNLDPNGKATFRWRNQSSYYFKIYYNNTDYSLSHTLLNEGYMYRNSYARSPGGSKFQNQVFNVNEVNKAPPDSKYHVKEYVYTNGSTTEFGNIKIINTTVTLENMNDQLTNVSIYYIDRDNKTGTLSHRLFFDDNYGLGDDSATIEIDLMTVDNTKLSSENREAYGLLIDIWGENSSSICLGSINISIDETWYVYNRTIISKLNIRVLGGGVAISDAIVTIKSNSTIYGQIVSTTLESDKDIGGGLALTENNLPFMYLSGYYYNISMIWQAKNTFNVSGPDPDQWAPNAAPWYNYWYNYSLSKYNFTLEFDIDLGGDVATDFKLRFDNITYDEDVIWNDNITVLLYFNSTKDDWASEAVPPLTDPDTLNAIVKRGDTTYLTFQKSDWQSPSVGYFLLEFNTSSLSAGFYGQFYKIIVSGTKSTYVDPPDKEMTFYIGGKESNITLHDYNSPTLDGIEDFQVSQYFGEEVNITIRFADNNTQTPLISATIAFDWLNLGDDETGFFADPINIGYFTLTLDTSLAEIVGPRTIKINAKIENYEEQVILVSLRIVERPTSLNGKAGLTYSNPKIWVQDSAYYNFTYRDLLKPTDNITGDLDIASYSWQRTDDSGTPILGQSGSGSLSQNADKIYTLDFGTSYRPVGFYQLYVTLAKENYEERFALLIIDIMLREFDADLDADNLDDDQITIVKGHDSEIEITLLDESRGNVPLTGAHIVLDIGGEEHDFDEDSPGVYTYTFTTDDYEAYFTSQTLTGEITIKLANFTSEDIDITIVISMEEISPGMPTFYFLMVLGIIVGVVGSLASYRIIQQSRIPKYVKKLMFVQKKIKSRDSITGISIPSKNRMILKQFSEAWSDIGLSLEEILGIVDKEPKTLTKKKAQFKKDGGNA